MRKHRVRVQENVPVHAILKNARLSAQKCRLIADLIRGKSIHRAFEVLRFMPQKGAALLLKLLDSAVANAEHNVGIDVDTLKISSLYVDKGPSMRRMSARAKGRGNRIIKQTCHVKLTVEQM